MKIIRLRRTVVARSACPVCYEPARACPPRMWVAANGPRPSWSHVDGEPLCPVVGADGYRPARRACMVTAVRAGRSRRPGYRASITRRTITRRAAARPAGVRPATGTEAVFLVAGGDMVAVFDNAEAAGIMALTMIGANLEPVSMRLTPAQWDEARTVLQSHQPHITITDARSGRAAGTP